MRAKSAVFLAAALAVLGAAVGSKLIGIKRELAAQREEIQQHWARVEAALQHRADAIPHVIALLAAGEHSAAVPEIEAARAKLAQARGPEEKIRANRELSLALARLLLRCETNSEVRHSGGFKRLREELAARDDEIATERFQYNNALEHYNARMLRFPDNVVASLAGFTRNDAYFGTGPDSPAVP